MLSFTEVTSLMDGVKVAFSNACICKTPELPARIIKADWLVKICRMTVQGYVNVALLISLMDVAG